MANGTLYTFPDNFRAYKALVSAQYSGAKVLVHSEPPEFIYGETNKSSDFLQKFPFGKVPAFENGEGVHLFESNAIACFLANDALRGASIKDAALVRQWMEFADGDILPAAFTWVFPCMGLTMYNKQATTKAKDDIRLALNALNQHLMTRTFLVGEHISLADIAVSCDLLLLYQWVLDPEFRQPYQNVNRWFVTLVNQPEFKNVIGDFKLCEKMAQFDNEKYVELQRLKAKGGKNDKTRMDSSSRKDKKEEKDNKQDMNKINEDTKDTKQDTEKRHYVKGGPLPGSNQDEEVMDKRAFAHFPQRNPTSTMSYVFEIESAIFKALPKFKVFFGVVRKIDVEKIDRECIQKLLEEAWQLAQSQVNAYANVQSHPNVELWRKAFQSMKISVKKYNSSVESMAKRAAKAGSQPFSINPLVDFYNALSLKYLIPFGGFDMESDITKHLSLRFSKEGDKFLALDSDTVIDIPVGEPLYVSGNTVTTRYINWKQGKEGLIQATSSNVCFQSEVLNGYPDEQLSAMQNEFKMQCKDILHAEAEVYVLDESNPSIAY